MQAVAVVVVPHKMTPKLHVCDQLLHQPPNRNTFTSRPGRPAPLTPGLLPPAFPAMILGDQTEEESPLGLWLRGLL
jgi:hypothetical protein